MRKASFVGRWFERRYVPVLCLLLAVAAATRVALVVGAPRPFGYAWDLYHESVVWTYEHGRLPLPSDCGECYHPPLYAACGLPLYALGAAASRGGAAAGLRLLCLFSMACGCVVVYSCHRTLSLLNPSRGVLLLGTSLALVFPCLFIASYGAENDALLAALMSLFFYRLCLHHLRPARSGWRGPVLIGALAGLSALTKFSGLLAPITAAIVMGPGVVFGRRRLRAARDVALALSVAAASCGWYYARGARQSGRALAESSWAPHAFEVGVAKVARNWRRYDFLSFKIEEVVDLYRPGPNRILSGFPVYKSVFSTLHALAWTDMSFFSVPSRHAWVLPVGYAEDGADMPMVAATPARAPRVAIYPPKRARLWLIDLVLRLGVVPGALALVGFAATLRRRALRPFAAFTVVSLAVYVWWFLAQDAPWALKTKYILFLLPAYVVYALTGLRALFRCDRRLGYAATAGLIAALVSAEAYLWMFALG